MRNKMFWRTWTDDVAGCFGEPQGVQLNIFDIYK